MKNLTSLPIRLLILTSLSVLGSAPLMAAIWGGGSGTGNAGNLNRATNWTGGAVPGPTGVAQFSTTGGAITPEFSASTAWGSILDSRAGAVTLGASATST